MGLIEQNGPEGVGSQKERERKHRTGVMAWGATPKTNHGGKKKMTHKGVHPGRMTAFHFFSSFGVGVRGGSAWVEPPWRKERQVSRGGWRLAVEWA